MAKVKISFVIISVVLTLHSTVAFPLVKNATNYTKGSPQPRALTRLVVSGTKTYYVDQQNRMSWQQAGQYCRDNGNLALATITDPNDWAQLVGAYNLNTFDGGFWTAGRDNRLLTTSQFQWANPANPGPDPFVDLAGLENVYEYPLTNILRCLAIASEANTLTYIYPRECSTPLGVLCQQVRP